MALDPRLVTNKETTLFKIGVAWSALCWLLVICTIVGGPYALFLLAFILMAHALFLARVRGNGVRVSRAQLPELYERVEAASKTLGMTEIPEVYLIQSGGILNAFATKLLSRKFIVLLSGLVSACEDPKELDFVVGHELGHLAAGHLKWNAFLLPFHILPWLGAAYSRAREYTCDRAGFAVVGDLEPACRALVILAGGGKLTPKVDLDAFADQRKESGTFWMATLELVATHPYLCKRVAALQEFKQPGTAPVVARTALAYPLAPLFGIAGGAGGAAGSFLMMIAVIGILAAIAIPNFMKYKERAVESQTKMMMQMQQLQQQADDDRDAPDPRADLDAPPPGPPAAVAPTPRPPPAVKKKHK